MKSFFSNSAFYLFGEGLSKGTIFIVTPIIINTLGKEDYGEFSLYISYLPFLSLIYDLGQRSSVKKFVLEHEHESTDFINAVTLTVVISFLITCILQMSFGESTQFTIFLILNTFLFTLIELYLSKYQITDKVRTYNLIYVCRNALPYLLFTISIIFFKNRLNSYYIIQFVIFALLLIFLLLRNFTVLKCIRKIRSYLKFSLSFSLPLLPAILSGVILNVSDRYLIEYFYDKESVGYYSLAYNVASIFMVFVVAVNKSWQSYILKCLRDNEKKLLNSNARKYIALALSVALLIFVLKDYLILMLSNESYMVVGDIVPTILIGMFFYFLYTLYSNIAFYYNETFYLALPAIIAACLNILLNILFLPIYGYKIAAYTTLASYAIEFGVIFFISWRRYKLVIF